MEKIYKGNPVIGDYVDLFLTCWNNAIFLALEITCLQVVLRAIVFLLGYLRLV